MQKKKLSLLVGLLCVFGLIAASCGDSEESGSGDGDALPGEGVTVNAARANWSTGYFQGALYSALLEELGYTVTDASLNELPPSNGYLAMAQGEIDFWANSWYPGHFSWYENELPDGTTVRDHVEVIGEELMGSGLEGLLITKSVAEDNNIESLEQIYNDPALIELFDTDGNGLANIFGCPEDWTCDDILSDTLSFNGWDDKIEQTKAGYDAMIIESVAKANNGEPVIQYTWSPSGYLTQLIPGENTLWLSLGSNDFVLDGSTNPEWDFNDGGAAALGDTCTASECYLGWVSADIQVTANSDFLAENPAAKKLFEVVTLSVLDVANQNVLYNNGEDTEDDIKAHAAAWISDNRDLVDGWISDARAAGTDS